MMKNLLAPLLCALLLAGPVIEGTAEAREAAPTAFDPVAHKRVVEVSEQLRCLVCQNQSIADSNAELAVCLFLVGIIAFYINLRRRKRLVNEATKPLSAQEKALADELLRGSKE